MRLKAKSLKFKEQWKERLIEKLLNISQRFKDKMIKYRQLNIKVEIKWAAIIQIKWVAIILIKWAVIILIKWVAIILIKWQATILTKRIKLINKIKVQMKGKETIQVI